MSRHEGVSCDSCLKGNFRGKRYKCLVCYDYDLCGTCYEAGASTTRHNADHPMQCILTRSDFDLYYGGETASAEHPQSFTCPFCGRMGLTESALTEHVAAEHSESSAEIVCPVCASQPGGEPNHVTDDFSAHLALDHRNREIDEPSSSRHTRRMPHTQRGMSSNRPRRSQMQFTSAGGLASLSPNSRESMDPIAELLSQLSSVRRSNIAQSNTTSQLQQLQMQLQMERQQAQMARQQLERLPRRQTAAAAAGISAGGASGTGGTLQTHFTVSLDSSSSPSAATSGPQFLLSRCTDPVITEGEQQALEVEHADRSLFVQELILNTLGEQFNIEELDSLVKGIDLSFSGDEVSPHYPDVNDNHGPNNRRDPTSAIPGPPAVQPPQQQEVRPSRNNSEPTVAQRQSTRVHSRGGAGNSYAAGNPVAGRGSGVAQQRANPREANVPRPVGRTTNRASSPTRRKAQRQVDDRNKTTEPPPPH